MNKGGKAVLIICCIPIALVFLLIFANLFKEKIDAPKISQEKVDMVTESIEELEFVEEACIVVKKEENQINFVVATSLPVNENYAKHIIADSIVRQLGSIIAYGNDNLKGPTKDSLGEIYDYYNILIAIGYDVENPEYMGAKVTGANKITW